jgi:hypothetical protein
MRYQISITPSLVWGDPVTENVAPSMGPIHPKFLCELL